MRCLTESERNRIFSEESDLEWPAMPIFVDPELEAVEGFPLGGEAVGVVRRRVVLHSETLDAPDTQLRALVAHELGHHEGRHGLLLLVWKVVMSLLGLSLWIAAFVGWLLTLNLWFLALLPLAFVGIPFVMLSSAFVSRRLEIAADRRAARLLGSTAPLEALCEQKPTVERPSGLREWFWEQCHPWPRASERLRALRSLDVDDNDDSEQ